MHASRRMRAVFRVLASKKRQSYRRVLETCRKTGRLLEVIAKAFVVHAINNRIRVADMLLVQCIGIQYMGKLYSTCTVIPRFTKGVRS